MYFFIFVSWGEGDSISCEFFQYLIQCRGEDGMLHHGCASYYTSRVEQWIPVYSFSVYSTCSLVFTLAVVIEQT